MAKPIIKWAGGKTKVSAEIVSEMKPRPLGLRWTLRAEDNRYIEPFVGGAGAFLGMKRHGMIKAEGEKTVLLADINEVLVTTLRTMKREKQVEGLIKRLREMEAEFKDRGEEFYYDRRSHLNTGIIHDPSASDPIDVASHMIFLNKTCFNGLWRVNSKGELNTPIGRTPSGRVTILDEKALREFSQAIRETDIVHQDWKATLSGAGEGDLVYVDPPYWPTDGEYVFRDYDAKGGFDEKEQEAVAQSCAEAAARGARVIISNNYSEGIARAYSHAARKAGARISRARRGGSKQRRIALKRTMTKVKGEPRKEVEEILVFMGPRKS